jgi:glutaredoxin
MPEQAKKISLILVSVPGCVECKRFEEHWNQIKDQFPNVEYTNISAISPEGQELVSKHSIMMSPGIIVNSELFALGGIDMEKLKTKLKELS